LAPAAPTAQVASGPPGLLDLAARPTPRALDALTSIKLTGAGHLCGAQGPRFLTARIAKQADP